MADWLLLILCSVLIATGVIFMQAAGRRGATPWGLMLYLGLVSTAIILPLAWQHLRLIAWPHALLLVCAGAMGSTGTWAMIGALRRGPTGRTFVVRSFSIALPVAASVLLYDEPFGPLRIIGLAVIAVSIPLLQIKRSAPAADALAAGAASATDEAAPSRAASPHHVGADWFLFAALSLVFFGLADTIFRDAARPGVSAEFLLGVVALGFIGNLAGTVVGLALSRRRPTRADALWGSATGLVNLAAFTITLFVIRNMGGVLVFPARCVISIAAVVLLALVLFREHLTLRAAAGLALGTAGIVLLALKQ